MTQKQTNPITTWVNELLLHFWSDYGLSYAVRWLSLIAIFLSSTLFFTTAVREPRLVLLILIAFIYTFVSAARYLKDLYELPDLRMALEYLLGCSLFPSLLPKISVANGKVLLKEDEVNLIDRSGGPGTIAVDGKSVVLIERLNTYTKVLSEGIHKLERNEFIRDVVSLEEQHCKIENVEGMTVDGIRVRVHNIYARYQLKEKRTKPKPKIVKKDSEDNFIDDLMKSLEKQWDNFYHWLTMKSEEPKDKIFNEAMVKLSDNRVVAAKGLMSINDSVERILAGAIQLYINQHTIDQIITPEQYDGDSRKALKEALKSLSVVKQLAEIGFVLVGDPQLGELEFPDTSVNKFRLGRWKEYKKGEIKVMEAHGQAYELSRQDAVRSQTQVEMIRGILSALEDLNIEDAEDLDALIQFRTAQILDMWSGLYHSDTKDDPSIRSIIRRRDQEDEEE
ncbi:MAG TPA: hypothetical protein VLA32_00725 [Anaerolineales bacterium]|jgi:hypothetical protein|nr:hypothetical protein [Anaerolineales bacterium]